VNMSRRREKTLGDELVLNFDTTLRTLFGRPQITERSNPAQRVKETEMSEAEARHAAGLMRVNHTGEVCAQALYQGQALTARDGQIQEQMRRSALEENDHLDWCESRLKELGSHTSRLNPLWYAGSLAIGAAAGIAGDKWSLGFVAETEKQVEHHLDSHLHKLPQHDQRSRAIVKQMREDEIKHGAKARQAGGAELPTPVKHIMSLASKIMTKTAYKI